MNDLSLFDAATPDTQHVAATVQQGVTPPKWAANTTQTKCEHCQAAQHAGAAIHARRANLTRTTGDTRLYLCYVHATPIRDADDAAANHNKVTH